MGKGAQHNRGTSTEINLFPIYTARGLLLLNNLVAVGMGIRTVFAIVIQYPFPLLLVTGS